MIKPNIENTQGSFRISYLKRHKQTCKGEFYVVYGYLIFKDLMPGRTGYKDKPTLKYLGLFNPDNEELDTRSVCSYRLGLAGQNVHADFGMRPRIHFKHLYSEHKIFNITDEWPLFFQTHQDLQDYIEMNSIVRELG